MFTGRPTPTATWTVSGKTLKSSKRVEIKTTSRHSILMINDAERTDDGVYRLRVENKLGSDYVDIPITVIGKSSLISIFRKYAYYVTNTDINHKRYFIVIRSI